MTKDEQDKVVEKVYRDYWGAKETLAALEASLAEIAETSSITSDEGYLMFSRSGVRLLDTNYVREQLTQYHAAKQSNEALRKRLIELGEPDPE
jgi:hypothetical protein